ncbi:MAG: cyclopropane fatty acyl phospholipid synthase [Thiotrichales bacterium]
MKVRNLRSFTAQLLAPADVVLDGDRPWDIQVHSDEMFQRLFRQGSLGLGEAYMDGLWDAVALDVFFDRVLRAGLERKVRPWVVRLAEWRARLVNLQTPLRAHEVAEVHYDLGNAFFETMLDPRLVYSCGYWRDATTLAEAQTAKLALVSQKLGLQPGMRVLDIGCGWGSSAHFMAERYGVAVVGLTVSTPQAEYARERCAGLPVEIRVQDYRETTGAYDAIVSVGMFEHVGSKNYRTYMEVVERCLAGDGLCLLHTLGKLDSREVVDPWIERYIFPNSELPAMTQLATALEGLLVIEDIENIGADYDPTLMAWYANFERAWPQFSAQYGERFHRMWRYYLLSCAGAARARAIQVWQVVLSRRGLSGGYRRPTIEPG